MKRIGRDALRDILLVIATCWIVPFGVALPFAFHHPIFAVVFATVACALLLGLGLLVKLGNRIRTRSQNK